MKLLIVEPAADGHYMALYVRLIVRAAIRRNWHVQLLTTRAATNHPAFQLVHNEANCPLPVHLMPEETKPPRPRALSRLRVQLSCFNAVKRGFCDLLAHAKPDFVYMASLDHFGKVMALRGSPFGKAPFSGMLMHFSHHFQAVGIGPAGRQDRIDKWCFERILGNPWLRSLCVIDESFREHAKRIPGQRYQRLRFVPDVGDVAGDELRQHSRERLGISKGEFVILVYGFLSSRKGIRELLRAVTPIRAGRITILLAGNQDAQVQALVRDACRSGLQDGIRLIESRGFHDSSREFRVFNAADAVWLGYVDFYGASGVLLQAGSMGLPVLATREGLIGWYTRKYELGVIFDPKNKTQVAEAVAQLHDNATLRGQFGDHGFRLSREHTGEKFGEAVCDAINNV